MTFNDILQKKMSSSRPVSPRETPIAQGLDPAHLAYLMGQVGRSIPVSPRGKYAHRLTPVVRKAHVLSDLQREALTFMKRFMPSLDETMTAYELKKAFRLGAHRVHPDRGGSAELYAQLRLQHACLSTLFPKI
jgi:hypothetical protein